MGPACLPALLPCFLLCSSRVAVEDAESGLCAYRVKASIHGPDVKELYKEALRGAQKRANYAGFRQEQQQQAPGTDSRAHDEKDSGTRRTRRTERDGLAEGGWVCGCVPGVCCRKGVVPPQYLIAVKHNALNAAVLDACRHAVEAHGMANLEIKERPIKMVSPVSVDKLCDVRTTPACMPPAPQQQPASHRLTHHDP